MGTSTSWKLTIGATYTGTVGAETIDPFVGVIHIFKIFDRFID